MGNYESIQSTQARVLQKLTELSRGTDRQTAAAASRALKQIGPLLELAEAIGEGSEKTRQYLELRGKCIDGKYAAINGMLAAIEAPQNAFATQASMFLRAAYDELRLDAIVKDQLYGPSVTADGAVQRKLKQLLSALEAVSPAGSPQVAEMILAAKKAVTTMLMIMGKIKEDALETRTQLAVQKRFGESLTKMNYNQVLAQKPAIKTQLKRFKGDTYMEHKRISAIIGIAMETALWEDEMLKKMNDTALGQVLTGLPLVGVITVGVLFGITASIVALGVAFVMVKPYTRFKMWVLKD